VNDLEMHPSLADPTVTSTSTSRPKLPPVIIRNTRPEDFAQLDVLQRASYPQLSTLLLWRDEHWQSHIDHFPEGQWVAEVEGKVVGCCANLRVSVERATSQHTWKQITDWGTIKGHEPNGDILYGFEIMVHPDFRRRGIGKKLYQARFEYVRKHQLRGFIAMGRFPNYSRHGDGLTPEQYVAEVVNGTRVDRTLTAQIKSGCRVLGVVHDYLNDPKSGNAAAILLFENPERAAHGTN
jgi:ribosomal protein S18 acetylase RimI-like enzyme